MQSSCPFQVPPLKHPRPMCPTMTTGHKGMGGGDRIWWVWVGSPQRLARKPPPSYQSSGRSHRANLLGPKLRSEPSLTSNLWGVRSPPSRPHWESTPCSLLLHIPGQSFEPNSKPLHSLKSKRAAAVNIPRPHDQRPHTVTWGR